MLEGLRLLYERDKAICHICKEFVKPEDASRDHLIPRSVLKIMFPSHKARSEFCKDGKHIALAHKSCNEKRGATLLDSIPDVPPLQVRSPKKNRREKIACACPCGECKVTIPHYRKPPICLTSCIGHYTDYAQNLVI